MGYSMDSYSNSSALKYKLFLILSCCYFQVIAQQYSLLKTWQEEVLLTASDQGGNFYLINTQNQLKKYTSEGLLVNTYSQLNYGDIGSIDASNPLRIILYYPLNGKVIVLDRFLASIAEYSLRNLDIYGAISVNNAKGKGFWVYDDMRNSLLLLDQNMETVISENNTYTGNIGFKPKVSQTYSADDAFFLIDSTKGIFQFDEFGTYVKRLPFVGVTSFQLIDGKATWMNKNSLFQWQAPQLQAIEQSLPTEGNCQRICIANKRLLGISAKSVSLWAF